ncbi:transposase [Streptomyces sp. A0958]|nr:transposase [Streptomyces sp. A0958]
MALKDYSVEFRADAVALYESTPGATYKRIAADLGVNRATPREWVLRDRERRGAAALPAKMPARAADAAPAADSDERVRQLEARVAEGLVAAAVGNVAELLDVDVDEVAGAACS